MTQILIADDHVMVLDTLGCYLTQVMPELELTLASGLDETLNVLSQNETLDLAVVDYRMPNSQGLQTVRKLVANTHGIPIAMMSGLATPSDVLAMLEIGVIGFLPKTVSGASMTHALRLMLSGERYLPASIFSGPKFGVGSKGADGAKPEFDRVANMPTDKEMQVLALLRLGRSNKEIGRELQVEEVTVKLYVSRLCRKFEVNNRVQVLMRAMELGFID